MLAFFILSLLSAQCVFSQNDVPVATCYNGDAAAITCTGGLDACMLSMVETTLFDPKPNQKGYACVKSGSCARAFSLTVDGGKVLNYNSACCTGTTCTQGLEIANATASGSQNGLTCSNGCNAKLEKECQNSTVNCTGAETSCVNVIATTVATAATPATTIFWRGCTTEPLCELKDQPVTIGATTYTLSSDKCSSAVKPKPSASNRIMGQSSLILLLPSISSILYMKFLS